MVKKENPTREISDYDSEDIRNDYVFADNHVI